MKKALIIALGLAFASSAFADTNAVLSKNAVGYVKVDLIATNKLHLIRNDFIGLDAPIAISNTFAALPVNTEIIFWNKSSQSYRSPIGKTAFGWGSAGSNILPRGESFFLRTPSSATNTAQYSVYLMGEVPDQITSPTSTHSIAAGIGLEGYAYPVATSWTNTALAKALPVNSEIIVWNNAAQSYNAAIGKTAFGWGASGNALILQPGQGFVVRSPSAVNAEQAKPYTWP